MLLNEVITRRMEQNWEAPRVPEGDQVGLSGVVVNLQHFEYPNLLSCYR